MATSLNVGIKGQTRPSGDRIGDSNRAKRPDNRRLLYGNYAVVNRPWQPLGLEGQLPDLTNSRIRPKAHYRPSVAESTEGGAIQAVLPWAIRLAMPVSVHPLLILLPSTVLLVVAMGIAAATVKKYL